MGLSPLQMNNAAPIVNNANDRTTVNRAAASLMMNFGFVLVASLSSQGRATVVPTAVAGKRPVARGCLGSTS